MAELATIRIFEHARGRRYSAQISTSNPPQRFVTGERHEELIQAVLNVLAKCEKADRWQPGDRGRPPAARDIPGRLKRRQRGGPTT
jgi:hypothetical protein